MKIDYNELNAELNAVQAGIRAAECHGFLCGHYCSSSTFITASWQDYLLAGIDDTANLEDCVSTISELSQQVSTEISDDDISFNLLLPDDDTSMNERSVALVEWCVGFISGLGIGGLNEYSNKKLHDDFNEFIKDIVSISRMETSIEDNEAAENDLFEIIEYISVGVILLF